VLLFERLVVGDFEEVTPADCQRICEMIRQHYCPVKKSKSRKSSRKALN
jgi:hypothetical protein